METDTTCTGWTCSETTGDYTFYKLNNPNKLRLLALNSAVQEDAFNRIVRQWLAAVDSRQTQEQELLYQTQFETELRLFSRWLFSASSRSDAVDAYRGQLVSRFALLRQPTNILARRAPDGLDRDQLTLMTTTLHSAASTTIINEITTEKNTFKTNVLKVPTTTTLKKLVNMAPLLGLLTALHPWVGHLFNCLDNQDVLSSRDTVEMEDAAFKHMLGVLYANKLLQTSVDDARDAIKDRNTQQASVEITVVHDTTSHTFDVTVKIDGGRSVEVALNGAEHEVLDTYGTTQPFLNSNVTGVTYNYGAAPDTYEPLYKAVMNKELGNGGTTIPTVWQLGMSDDMTTNNTEFSKCIVTLLFPLLVTHVLDGNPRKDWRTAASKRAAVKLHDDNTPPPPNDESGRVPQATYVRKLQKVVDDVENKVAILHAWWNEHFTGDVTEETYSYLIKMILAWVDLYIGNIIVQENKLVTNVLPLSNGNADKYLPLIIFGATDALNGYNGVDWGASTLPLPAVPATPKWSAGYTSQFAAAQPLLGTPLPADQKHVTTFPRLWNGLHKLQLSEDVCNVGLESGCIDEWILEHKDAREEDETVECLYSIYSNEFQESRPMAAAMHGRSLLETHDVHPLTSAHYESARLQAYLMERTSETRAMKRRRTENAYADFDDEFTRTQHRQEIFRYPRTQRLAEQKAVMILALKLMTAPPNDPKWNYVPSHSGVGEYHKKVTSAARNVVPQKTPTYVNGNGVGLSEYVYQQTMHGANEAAYAAALKSLENIINADNVRHAAAETACQNALDSAAAAAPLPVTGLLGGGGSIEDDDKEYVLLPASSGGVVSGEVYIDCTAQWMCGGTFSLFSCAASLAVQMVNKHADVGTTATINDWVVV